MHVVSIMNKTVVNANCSYYYLFVNNINQRQATPLTTETVRQNVHNHTPNQVSALDSQALLGADGLVNICHNGEIYMLRRTRLGKLILTK